MLALTRKIGETIVMTTAAGERIEITLVKITGSRRIRLSFTAPKSVTIHRKEVQNKVDTKGHK